MNLRGANGDDLTVLSTDQLWALVREYIFYLNKHNQVKYSTRYSTRYIILKLSISLVKWLPTSNQIAWFQCSIALEL